MAENKKSFILYADQIELWAALSDEQAGKLIKHVFDYVNDKNPNTDDPFVKIAFASLKPTLKRDLQKWNEIREKRRASGRLGGIKSGESRQQNEANEANASTSKQNEANEAVSVSVSVNDNVNVNVNDNVISKEIINNNTSSNDEEEVYITSKKKVLKGKRLITFNKFWEIFNYKKGKAEAAQAWYDIPQLTDKLCDQIYESAKNESEARQKMFELGKTPKMAQGWLTSKRWEDQVFVMQEKPKKLTTLTTIASNHDKF